MVRHGAGEQMRGGAHAKHNMRFGEIEEVMQLLENKGSSWESMVVVVGD